MDGASSNIRNEINENKTSVVKPRRGREDNIKTDLKGIGCEHENWIHLARNRTRADSGEHSKDNSN
jgi:hypothetical protein